MFGMQITFEMMSYPLSVISLCYYLYKVYKYREKVPGHLWFRIGSWIFISIGKLYIINYICENVSAKVKQIFNIRIFIQY